MAQAARAAVNLKHDVPHLQAHRLCRLGVIDLLDHVQLDEMVSRAERSELRTPALLGARA